MMGLLGPAKTMSTFIAALMLVGMFMVLVVFVFNHFTDFGVMMKISSNQLNTIDLAYMTENCLREDGEYYISKERLDVFSADGIRYDCGIRINDAGVMVTNMETGDEWDFGYDGSDRYRHGIFVNIKEGDIIYVGQLNTSIGE